MKKDSSELGYCKFCKTESVCDRHVSFEVCPSIFLYKRLLMEISLVAPVDILAASFWTFSNSSFS